MQRKNLLLAISLVLGLAYIISFLQPVCYLLVAPKDKIYLWYPHVAAYWLFIRNYLRLILLFSTIICLVVLLFDYVKRFSKWVIIKRKEFLLALLSFCFALVAAEIFLRTIGYMPRQIDYTSGFTPVDTLRLYEGYLADSNAMTYINPTVAAKITRFLNVRYRNVEEVEEAFEKKHDEWINLAYDFQTLALDYAKVSIGADDYPFAKGFKKVESKKNKDDFDSLIVNYVSSPINSDGFRSIEFRKKSKRIRVLLIGDSFTYGYTTTNKTHSFYDLLLAKGIEAYNTGLNGSDPQQYQSVAEKYIPLVKPDVVIVNFYIGNDVLYFNTSLKPFQTYNYWTNAGQLRSVPLGVPTSSAHEVYQHAYESVSIPDDGSLLNKMCSSTVIGTFAWKFVSREFGLETQSKTVRNFFRKAQKYRLPFPEANLRMAHIKQLCDSNHSAFILSIIPIISKDSKRQLSGVESDSMLFPNMKYYQPSNLNDSDYCKGNDEHFNERGHAKYAAFLKTIIDSILSESPRANK